MKVFVGETVQVFSTEELLAALDAGGFEDVDMFYVEDSDTVVSSAVARVWGVDDRVLREVEFVNMEWRGEIAEAAWEYAARLSVEGSWR